jgi:large subunit ribosomal protein L21
MFAVIKTGGKQYKVQEGDVIEIEKLDSKEGQKVTFDQVLLVEADGKTLIGTPLVSNAKVQAEVLANFRDEKIIVFKKKRRKQYRKTRGHRQSLTRVKIDQILSGTKAAAKPEPDAKAPATKKAEAPKKAAPKAPAKKAAPKAAPKTAAKTAKPAPAKKTAAAAKPKAAAQRKTTAKTAPKAEKKVKEK